ncbi:hypothetical protein KKF34_20180 [Myxococcota bacterium]|nr:hypothetical protein [Myxococcota bacterium]MBU1499208.1 hypothetical protein [Myxococcota bacterium]
MIRSFNIAWGFTGRGHLRPCDSQRRKRATTWLTHISEGIKDARGIEDPWNPHHTPPGH